MSAAKKLHVPSKAQLDRYTASLSRWPLGHPCPGCKRFYTLVGLNNASRRYERVCSMCGFDAMPTEARKASG